MGSHPDEQQSINEGVAKYSNSGDEAAIKISDKTGRSLKCAKMEIINESYSAGSLYEEKPVSELVLNKQRLETRWVSQKSLPSGSRSTRVSLYWAPEWRKVR